jgi:phage baseplate assembly protein W
MTTVDQVGRGWNYPLGVSAHGGIALASGASKIEQAMQLVLATYPGERPMRNEFGSRLRDFVFEGVTLDNIERIKHEVREALERWEPRVDIADVVAYPDDSRQGVILIDISYVIKHTMGRRNLVFPFYTIPEEEGE